MAITIQRDLTRLLRREYPGLSWEPELTAVRDTDAAPARLLVPTPAAFAAWERVTWLDRHASRDLYDLWSLARLGHINAHAAELFTHHGPTNRPPAPWMFDKPRPSPTGAETWPAKPTSR